MLCDWDGVGGAQPLGCDVPKPGPSLRTSKGFLEGPERLLLSWVRPWKKVGPWAAGVQHDQSPMCTGAEGEVVKGLGSILSRDGELLTSGVTPSDLPSEGRSPGGGSGLGASPGGDSGGVGVGRGLADMGKAARGWPPGTVQMEGRVWRNAGGGTDHVPRVPMLSSLHPTQKNQDANKLVHTKI